MARNRGEVGFDEEARAEEEKFREVEGDVDVTEMGTFIKFNVIGESISGLLEAKRLFRSQFKGKEQTVYDIRTPREGEEEGTDLWTITGNADLNHKMEKVREGSFIRITYVDDREVPNRPDFTPMRIFKVEVSREPSPIASQKKSPLKIRG